MPFGSFRLNSLSKYNPPTSSFTPVEVVGGVGWNQIANWVDGSTGYTYTGWYTVYVTASGYFDVISGGDIEYILVGAGGAGGGCSVATTTYTVSGGGGGGQVIRNTVNLPPGNYTYTIGTGGIGTTTAAYRPGISSTLILPGGTVTCRGGAGGAYWSGTAGLAGQGTSSYCGGGGAKPATSTATTSGGTGYNTGYSGGSAFGSSTTTARSSGGGGGQGGAGVNGTSGTGGNGGLGLHITDFFPDITLYLAGGGGGAGGVNAGGAQTQGAGSGTRGSVAAGINADSGMSYPFFYAGSGGGGVCRTTTGTYTGGNGSAGALLIKYRIA